MSRFTTTGCLLIPLLAASGCVSVPEVESRLQTLQFYPNLYIVRAGDTPATVAWRYELSPAELAALNPGLELSPTSRLTPGQRLNVRPGTSLPDAVREGTTVAGTAAPAPRPAWGRETRVEPAPRPAAPVIVSPVATRAPVPAPVPTSPPPRSPDDEERLFARADTAPYPREEIVPDELDAAPAPVIASGDSIDAALERYVGRWTWPLEGAVARGFAPGEPDGQGVDIAGVPGQDVRAALDGTVVYSGRDLSGGGKLVIVRHDDDLMTTYSHADQLYVAEDDRVLAGDPIASLGANERSESVLRFEVRRDGSPLDPLNFLPPAP